MLDVVVVTPLGARRTFSFGFGLVFWLFAGGLDGFLFGRRTLRLAAGALFFGSRSGLGLCLRALGLLGLEPIGARSLLRLATLGLLAGGEGARAALVLASFLL
ncbi:MAG: hypothetical protein IPI67_21305 [Myxococcales bacterium]|nr:hypothetical protein [Myxococcales bacterium]